MRFSLKRLRYLRLIYLGAIICFIYFVLIRGNVLDYLISGMRHTLKGPSNTATLTPEDAAALQGRINELEAENLALSEQNFLLGRKLELNDAAVNYGLPYTLADSIKADVVYTDHGAMYRSAMLNRGTADGVSVYDPVVGPKGLLGRVISVEEHFCNILLLTDPECKFGAFIRRTREIGLAMGNGHGVILSHMNKQSDVQSGDLVLTSHDSGLTPAGILIGEVDQVEVHEDELMLMITIKPASDFNRLDSVIILKYGKSPK